MDYDAPSSYPSPDPMGMGGNSELAQARREAA